MSLIRETTMSRNLRLLSLALFGVLLALAVASAEARSKAEETAEELKAALEALHCEGPRVRVAVYGFYATGKLAAYEGFNVGDGLAAQLATELDRTGCFVVLDRTGLSDVLREQELGLAGVVSRETAAPAGRMVGAEVIIKGSVTEFDPNQRGGGMTLGFALPDTPLGVRLGRNGSQAHVGLDISLVDASTGQVRSAHRVTATSKTGGWTLGLVFERASLGGDRFAKTPLGIASRNALGQAVLEVADDLASVPWRSQVVAAEEDSVFLNAGVDTGIRSGDVYKVSTVVRTLVDPATGLLLDTIEREVGEVRIVTVTDKYAMAEPIGEFRIRRGDYVHL